VPDADAARFYFDDLAQEGEAVAASVESASALGA
jgi:hypothetical protein